MHTKSLTCSAILLCLSACSSGPVPIDSGDIVQQDVIEDPGPSDVSTDSPWDLAPSDILDETALPDTPANPGFLISIIEARSAKSSPYAFVSVSNPPATEMPQTVKAEVNGCKFMEPEEPGQCQDFCSWPGYCGSDNTCHEGTPRRFAGDISLTGLEVDCSLPIESYDGQYPYYMGVCDPAEPTNLFDKGTAVTATAAGGDDLPAFTLQAPGVADIVTTLQCDGFELESGKYLQVLWEPSDQTGDRIQFYLRSANHGTQFGHIVCDSPDNGVLVVESNLIDMHLAAFNPAPSWGLIRVHTEVKEVDGMRVALETRNQISCMY